MDVQKILIIVTLIVTALLAVSECLALIPSIKSNSVFTLVYNVLSKIKGILGKLVKK